MSFGQLCEFNMRNHTKNATLLGKCQIEEVPAAFATP